MSDLRSAFSKVSAEMIADMALGAEDLTSIATRYGLTLAEWSQLEDMPWFAQEVLRKRAEFSANGTLFQRKVQIAAEVALDETLKRVMTRTTADKDVLEAFKYFAKLAGHEPQQGAGAAGSGFSIQINIPAAIGNTQPGGVAAKVVEATPLVVIDTDKVDEKPASDIPGTLPTMFRVPDFDLSNAALTALPKDVAEAST